MVATGHSKRVADIVTVEMNEGERHCGESGCRGEGPLTQASEKATAQCRRVSERPEPPLECSESLRTQKSERVNISAARSEHEKWHGQAMDSTPEERAGACTSRCPNLRGKVAQARIESIRVE